LCVSNNSNEVCERIIQTGFHVDMLKNLSWDTLSVDSLNIAQSDVKICIVKWLIGTLHNVLRRAKTGCSALRQCQAVNVLQKFRNAENQVIFGRPFVKRFALCYQTVVCPVCRSVSHVCPVCNVGVLWPNGWTDQDETWLADRPRPWPHCV